MQLEIGFPRCRLWRALLEQPSYMSDRILVMQILHVQAVQGLLSTQVMHLLLTDKLSKINVASWNADEPAYFWRLFKTCFELVSSTVSN